MTSETSVSEHRAVSPAPDPLGLHWKDEPIAPITEGDKFYAASENMLAVVEKEEAIQLRKITGHSVAFELRRPKDVFRTATAKPYQFDYLPADIAYLAQSFADATGYDQSGVIVSALIGAASTIDDRYKLIVRPESDWYESARLWAVLIGTPSSGKSPSMRAATGYIKTMHEIEVMQWQMDNQDVDSKERPPAPALYTSDTTIAGLEELLKGNPRGILMLTEEFDTWIGAIDATDRGQGAVNRGNWLQLYDGGSKQTNRINRGPVFVPNWGASVLAACAPAGLQRHMKQLPDDGLIHRFIPAIMGPRSSMRKGDARHAIAHWNGVLTRLRRMPPAFIELSPEARQLFDQEDAHKSWLSEALYESSPPLASHLGKHGGMLARVALTFHAIVEPQSKFISGQTMWNAILFCRHVARHAGAMFDGILSTSTALSLARALGRSIVAEVGALTTIGRQRMSDHCAEFRKEDDDRVKREAVQILEDADWLEQSAGARSYGGWPTKWTVHERLWNLYSTQGEEWRQRRAAVREAIGLQDAD